MSKEKKWKAGICGFCGFELNIKKDVFCSNCMPDMIKIVEKRRKEEK